MKEEESYYNGGKLLSLMDIRGKKPELYIICGNRTAGKTYYVKRYLLRRFIKHGEKFGILVRYKYELGGCAEDFFKDLEQVDFPGHTLTSKPVGKDLFQELLFDGKPCGYVIPLANPVTIKNHSSHFVDCDNLFLDEFQSESKYLKNEVQSFLSIHTSIARGGGKHRRRVPVFMCGNRASIVNPYYVELGIHKRLKSRTRFLRGDGWVLEQTFKVNAAEEIKKSGIGRAFSANRQMQYATSDQYLLDNSNFIKVTKGEKLPVCTVVRNKQTFGVWMAKQSGIVYISDQYDPSNRYRYTVNIDDHDGNTALLRDRRILQGLRRCFDEGNVAFQDAISKDTYLDLIGYLDK